MSMFSPFVFVSPVRSVLVLQLIQVCPPFLPLPNSLTLFLWPWDGPLLVPNMKVSQVHTQGGEY